jgi:hypothetical protein
MTATEIRDDTDRIVANLHLRGSLEAARLILLAEIAAQLAELNHYLRKPPFPSNTSTVEREGVK